MVKDLPYFEEHTCCLRQNDKSFHKIDGLPYVHDLGWLASLFDFGQIVDGTHFVLELVEQNGLVLFGGVLAHAVFDE